MSSHKSSENTVSCSSHGLGVTMYYGAQAVKRQGLERDVEKEFQVEETA